MPASPPVTSSQQAVLDALLTKLNGLTFTVSGITDTSVYVFDGYPGQNKPQCFVTLAGVSKPSAAGTETWAAIGNLARYERYNVDLHIWSYCGGNSEAGAYGSNDAQKTARDNAASMLATIEASLLEDANLALENNNSPLVIWCLIAGVNLTQTNEEDASAKGRYAHYAITINVYNRLEG